MIWNLVIQKAKWQPEKIEWYRDMIKSITQHSYFEKKPIKQMGRLQNNPSFGNLNFVNFCSSCWTIVQWKREFWWLELFVFVQKHMLVFLCFANVAIFIKKLGSTIYACYEKYVNNNLGMQGPCFDPWSNFIIETIKNNPIKKFLDMLGQLFFFLRRLNIPCFHVFTLKTFHF